MACTFRVAELARRELREQIVWLEERHPPAAAALVGRVEQAIELLASGRVEGRQVVLTTGREVRRWRVAPLLLFYVRDRNVMTVLRIRHEAQRPIAKP